MAARPQGLERKLSGSDRALSGYQPFSASHPEDEPPPPPPPAERDKEFRPGNKSKVGLGAGGGSDGAGCRWWLGWVG